MASRSASSSCRSACWCSTISRYRPSARYRRKPYRKWLSAMRSIDLHCYPGTKVWIACQGPYVEALATYWRRSWIGKPEEEVVREFTDAGIAACAVAVDLESTRGTD